MEIDFRCEDAGNLENTDDPIWTYVIVTALIVAMLIVGILGYRYFKKNPRRQPNYLFDNLTVNTSATIQPYAVSSIRFKKK